MKKILQLSYTPLNGKNGGSQRALQIARVLEKNFDVRTISFDVDPTVKTEFIDSIIYINRHEYYDFCKGQYEFEMTFIMQDRKILKKLLSIIAEYKNDIILITGANLYPLIKYVVDFGFFNGKLIYDSHGKADSNNAQWLEAEQFFRTYAHCIISTNKLDHDVLGSKSKIFRSGSFPLTYKPNSIWENKLNNYTPNYAFVASDNDINFASINKFIPLVPPNINVLLVGSICNRIVNTPHNIIKLGFLSDEELEALMMQVDGMVMPMTINDGGINVKTAEAIVSKKAAIGTKEAFSGFEDFLQSPGIFCCDSLETIIEEMKKTHERLYNREVNPLIWESALNGLTEHVIKCIN
jgi:hypothetical protein